MNINENQRWILWIYTGLILYLSILHTPWVSHSKYSSNYGYAPIWDESMSFQQIDYNRLIMSIVVVTIVCGIIFLLCGEKKTPEETKDVSNSSTKLSSGKKDALSMWLGTILGFGLINAFYHFQPKNYIPGLIALTIVCAKNFFFDKKDEPNSKPTEYLNKDVKLISKKVKTREVIQPELLLTLPDNVAKQIINEINSDPDFEENKTIQQTLIQFAQPREGKSKLNFQDVAQIVKNQLDLGKIGESTHNKAINTAGRITNLKR